MPGRDNPFERFEELFDRLESEFGELGVPTSSIPVDLIDEGDAFVARVDLPGYDPDGIDVRIIKGKLHVKAESDETVANEDGRYVRRERRRGTSSQSVVLPEPVVESEVGATYDAGVLSVRLPKEDHDAGGTEIDIE